MMMAENIYGDWYDAPAESTSSPAASSAGPSRDMGGMSKGGEPKTEESPEVKNRQATANNGTKDVRGDQELRTILKVPADYIQGDFAKEFAKFGGVMFPYSPQITLESKAEYSSNTPLHSNYPINFYKNSSVGDITITSTFTVQDEDDAYYYIGAIRILSALTKMRFGNDSMAGSPPPICRLSSYGEWVLKNVPVVVTSVRHDLPDDVDFYKTYVRGQLVSVPTKASVTVACKPTYSRKEMASATVDSYIKNTLIGKGYL